MPHHLLAQHLRLSVTGVVLSVLVSLWALYLDPVINVDGTLYVRAAERFANGDWAAGLAVYKWPFYSMVIGAVAFVTGMAGGHAAYLVNAGFYALTVLGFVAFVKVLGGGTRILWIALFVALLHPVLTEFRSFIIRDVGYWACYLWSLAFFFAYVRHEQRSLLLAGWLAALAAFLFRIEGVVLLTILPACIYASRSHHATRAAVVVAAAALATAAGIAAAPVWQYVSEVNVTGGDLLAAPLHHIAGGWSLIGEIIGDRLQALQREFPGLTSSAATMPVYLITVLIMIILELVKSLGVVFTGLIVYAFCTGRLYVPGEMRRWWLLATAVQLLLVLQFGLANFFLAERYPVALALTMLPVVPFFLDELWGRVEGRGLRQQWRVALIAGLIVIESLEGLNVGTGKQYLKDAGLWLRANAPAGSSVYSNNRILVYYSGLEEPKPGGVNSWEAAMREVWTDNWRNYDYFALVMTKSNRRNEVLLFRRIDAEPVKTFGNEDGDRVLIFSPD